jgi:hypothetical protein
MTIKARELDSLLKILRKHKVDEFEKGDLKVKLSPLAQMTTSQVENLMGKSENTDDDLFYSANQNKIKGLKNERKPSMVGRD